MRKYSLCLMLIWILVFLLTSCSQTSIHGTPAPIKNLNWGMNEEEVMNALKISEKDITKINTGLAHNDQINLNYPTKLYGRTAEVSFTFSYHILIGITAQFKPEDVAYVENAIAKERGTGIYKYNGKNEKNDVTWQDDLLENNKTWKAAVEDIYKNLGIQVSDDPMKDGISVGQKPITWCRLTIDNNSPLYGNLYFNGDVASMLNYPEKYAPELILK